MKAAAPSTTYPSLERRMTKQRQVVLGIVEQSKAHPSAEEVFRLARKKLPAVSLATVYRNLSVLAEEGKIREVQFHGNVVRYDGMLEPHEHFCCRACGHVEDLRRRLPESMARQIERELGGTVEEYALDYYGLCRQCVTKASRRSDR